MELRATMELRDGRGGQLGEEDTPYIVERQIQPLSTYSACDLRYYRSRQAVLPLARQELDQPCCVEAESSITARVVLPLALAVLPQGRVCLGWEGTNEE